MTIDSIGFVARVNLPYQGPPTRAYVHQAGLDLFGADDPHAAAKQYLLESLAGNRGAFADQTYLLAAVWGDAARQERVIDVFGFSDVHPDQWPGNPDVSGWVIRNGIIVPSTKLTCGDMTIVLGEEEKYRRNSRSLEEYLVNPPVINERIVNW